MAETTASHLWRVRGREIDLSRRTLVMGVLNVTPDSFSEAGDAQSADEQISRGLGLASDGADIIDIGGESTRPGRPETVSPEEEIRRVIPVVTELRKRLPQSTLISIDTYKEEVAKAALERGADIINDIYALRRSPSIAAHCAEHKAGLILMHMQGDPETMQQSPRYKHVLVDIRDFLRERISAAVAAGVPEQCIAVDPGIGFGKTMEHNVRILAGLEYLRLLQRPICVGASRKGFLGRIIAAAKPDAALGTIDNLQPAPVNEREDATVAAHCAAALLGAAIIRTHNVISARRSLAVIDAIRAAQ